MENVPNVLTAPEWPSLVGRLEAMGYCSRWAKLDSSDFGSAQKRIRAFMVSRLVVAPPELPGKAPNAPMLCLKDIMEPERDERYIRHIPMDRIKWRAAPSSNGISVVADWDRDHSTEMANRLYSPSFMSPTLIAHGGGGRDIKIVADDSGISYERHARLYSDDSKSPALLACSEGGSHSIKIIEGTSDAGSLKVCVLTPRESWRLMGFPEWAYLRASRVSSETQLYNQAGNSIVVEVLMAIFRAMFPSAPVRRQATLEEACA